MTKKISFIKNLKNYLPAQTGKSILNRHIGFGFLAFIMLAVLFSALIYQRYLILKEKQKKEAYVKANNTKDKLQEALASGLSATKILSFFVDHNGTVKNFDSVAAQIFSTNKNIDALVLVPGGVVQYIYPLKGNEIVIGHNILTDPARNKEAFKAIQKRELFFSGPYKLKQGGFGIVGRLPVFRNGKFWGFSSVVIKMATLLKAAGIDSTGKDGYYYQLSKINPDTKKQEFFIPHTKEPLSDYLFSVYMPEGDWKLSVEPVDNNKGQGEIIILCVLGFLFSVLGAVFVFIIVKRPEKLDRLVKERTKELKRSENKYRSLIERVSDAFVSIDKDWNYTYVNRKAGEIFSKDPEYLTGKNIWAQFPEAKDLPMYHAYYRAMQTQEYQYIEEYFEKTGKWFENHIYPSANGLTIFFKDVTEIKQVSLALKENEEKYRSLIEQASDGIVITDLDGYILEVNRSIKAMIGFADEEIIGHHVTAYIPNEDIELLPLRINELMQGKSLLYERRLVKKDGSVLEVEVNTKMASSHTIIGFLRDITERKRVEEALQKSYEDIRQLASSLQSIREDERTNIAREIHDELGQQLTGLKMDLHWLARKINSTDKEINDKMKESIELINTTIVSVRKISTNLRPSILDDLGLLAALEWQSEEFEKRSGTKVEFINNAGDITVQPEATTGIFRIYQELLTNIARHANASLVTTVLYKDDNRLYFSITDNGVGFNIETISNKKTLGLLGIKERTLLLGGTYEFKSKPDEGLVTTISIPLNLVKKSI